MPSQFLDTQPSAQWLADLYDTQYNSLCAYAYRRLGHPAAAHDLAATIFHDLVRHLQAGKGLEPPVVAWLYTRAARRVSAYWRGRTAPAEQQPRLDLLHAAMAKLDPLDRHVLDLCYFGEVDHEAAALHLATSAAQIARRLPGAIGRLRKQYDAPEFTPPPPDPAHQARLRAEVLTAFASVPTDASTPSRRVRPAETLRLGWTTVESPWGTTYVACTNQGIAFLTWTSATPAEFALLVRSRYAGAVLEPDDALRPQAEAAMAAYYEGDPTPYVDLSRLTPFERNVLETCAAIVRGSVRSYGWIAKEMGNPGAVRAVGTALARNPVPLLIPCHRVVAGTGRIGNYSGGGPEMKQRLLTAEGIDLARLPQALATPSS